MKNCALEKIKWLDFMNISVFWYSVLFQKTKFLPTKVVCEIKQKLKYETFFDPSLLHFVIPL